MRITVISTASLKTPPDDYGGMELQAYLLTKGLEERGHRVGLIAKRGSYYPNGGLIEIDNENEILSKFDGTGSDVVIDMSHDKCLSHVRPELPIIEQYQVMSMTGIGKNPVLISNGQRDTKFPRLECEIIYQHIDLSQYIPNYGERQPFYLYMGQIIEEKRVNWAIQVAIDCGVPLKVRGPWWGDSKYMDSLREMAKGRLDIDLGDSVGGQEKLDLIRNAKALLHFPGAKGFCEAGSIITLEALASGTPVVVSRNGVHEEYVKPGVNGFIVDSIDEAKNLVWNDAVSIINKHDCRQSVEWAHYPAMAEQYEMLARRVMNGEHWNV